MRLIWMVVLCFAFDVAFHEDVERDFEVVDGDREAEKRIVLAFDLFEPATTSPTRPVRTKSPTAKPTATVSPTFAQSGSFSAADLRSMNVIENESWGRNVVVFVLDTGCQIDRFPPTAIVRPGVSFVHDEPDTSVDLHGHGTHVAGLIHAVAPKAEIVCVRVFDRRGDGYLTSILKAFQHVAKRCAESSCVLNLSGGAHESKLLDEAATRLVLKRNVVVVAAAGNYVETKCLTPARTPWVVSVGASDLRKVAFISAHGPCVDVFAPGVSVPSFAPHGWAFKSGTSMANAYVAGIAAKTKSKIRDAKRVHAYIVDTAETFQGIKFARASDERETKFTVLSDERVHRDWFINCIAFVSDEYRIDFEDKHLVRTNHSLRFGNVEFKTNAVETKSRIVWDNAGGAVFENDVYVAKWTWKRNRRMTLGRGNYLEVRSCVDVVPPHEPCPMRDFKSCTPPCVWTDECRRPLDCGTTDPVTCAKFKRCTWRKGACHAN